MDESEIDLRTRLNAETGKLVWPELERHFARGVVIRVDPALDLIDVAVAVAEDDKAKVEAWMQAGRVAHPSMEDARAWVERQPDFWAVVVAPWVLVQDVTE
ncbi:hypothetical protein Tel_03060 [Candidatus Tenderia electrophaga]|uniref:DUF2288 domain-containing protein n=1 Tax=Candidatus Tenderia electrophaga TaxID=1748243 RepID=A0A0S2THV1_9GAMM|nr:hypothetical protein Tel_03060 [Candidatus Tenderia electrophaga]